MKVVSERLGHKRIEITLNVYAHALPSMQQEAAAISGLLDLYSSRLHLTDSESSPGLGR